MRSRSFLLALVSLAIACSASETANHSIRCDSNSLCPNQMVCYREFCIPNDELPRIDLDASVVVAEPVTDDTVRKDASPSVEPRVPLDASSADDAALITTEDAQTSTTEPPPPVRDVPTKPAEPPTTVPNTPVVPPDAGSPVSDAGRVTSSALLICVPSCASRSSGCWFCLNGVLATNPGICSPANRTDPVSSGFCEFLCATAACRGEP